MSQFSNYGLTVQSVQRRKNKEGRVLLNIELCAAEDGLKKALHLNQCRFAISEEFFNHFLFLRSFLVC